MIKNIVLVILDGWGIAETWGGNAISLANTPTMDKLKENYPYNILSASGEAVGLPFNEPGNSEVGHLNIGSGQEAHQGLSAINKMVSDGSFFTNPTLTEFMQKAKKANNNVHLIGLLSDGGIHSHISHLIALLELAKKLNLEKVILHLFTDGRDAPPTSGIKYIEQIKEKMEELQIGKIASISGRYYAMDRDNHWDRVEKVYNTIILGEGKTAETPEKAVLQSYISGITDEFIVPTIVNPNLKIKDNDSIILFNFRSDRARQLAHTLVDPVFNKFQRKLLPKNLKIATFSSYQEGLPVVVIFEKKEVKNTLVEALTQNNLTHGHVAETEKYPHVTYFFNGGNETPLRGETRILVPSPKVATYDLKPEMSAQGVLEKAKILISNNNFTVVNFANPDMVGHTGDFAATTKAVETVDKCLGELVKKALSIDCLPIVTADHGNAEEMIDPVTGLPYTEHTNNPVPFIILDKKIKKIHEDGKLSDISPTILKLFNLSKPAGMTGKELF